jgi:hypothetical protein
MVTVLPDHCWIGPRSIRYRGQMWLRYKLFYTKVYGPVPAGFELAHRCHNGPGRGKTRCCWNPHHVRPLTHEENMRESWDLVTECPNGHRYTEANTYWHNGYRHCRACRQIFDRRRGRRRGLERYATPVSGPHSDTEE